MKLWRIEDGERADVEEVSLEDGERESLADSFRAAPGPMVLSSTCF